MRVLIISFAWTIDALISGNKTCTRRQWDPWYAQRFTAGKLIQAYSRLPIVGGKRRAVIKLTRNAYPERTSQMTDSDYEAEGLAWMERQGLKVNGIEPRRFFDRWLYSDELVWVVWFDLESVSRGSAVS